MAGHQFEAPFLRKCSEEQDAFHPRESLADADTRAPAEGDVGKFRAVGWQRPTLGVELLGVREPARVAMNDEGAHHEYGSRGDAVFANRVFRFCAPADDPR